MRHRRNIGRVTIMWFVLAGLLAWSGRAADAPRPLQALDELVATLPRHDAGGQVVDQAGKPVAGADVFLYYQHGAEGYRDHLAGRTKTDAQGQFHFSKAVVWEPVDLNESHWREPAYAAIARDEKLGIAFTAFRQGDPVEGLKITLAGKETRTVSVYDTAGHPLEGARVYLSAAWRPGGNQDERDEYNHLRLAADIGLSSGLTGKDGMVQLPAPQGGQYWVEKDGYVRVDVDPFVLCPSGQLSGRVTDAVGAPLPGIPVRLAYDGQGFFYYDCTVTGTDGRYTFRNAPAAGFRYARFPADSETKATQTLTISARDNRVSSTLAGASVSFSLKPGDKVTQDLILKPGVLFAGQIVSAQSGLPVPGVKLVRTPDDGSKGTKGLRTDDAGRFRVYYPGGSEVGLVLERPHHGEYILEEDQTGSEIYVTRLNADKPGVVVRARVWQTGPLQGTVVDEHGKPVPQASVYVHSQVPPVTTDQHGRFTLKTAPRDHDFDLLALSKVASFGAARFGVLAHFKAGTTSVTLRMGPLVNRQGRVVSTDGKPVSDLALLVALRLSGSDLYLDNQWIHTGRAGTFVIKDALPKATYRASWNLIRSSNGVQNAEYDAGDTTVDLGRLKSGAPIELVARRFSDTLRGKVVDERGRPLPGAQLYLVNDRLLPPGRETAQFTTDQAGCFIISPLLSGTIPLRVFHPRYKTRLLDLASNTSSALVRLTPRDGELITRIQVLDAAGQPVPDAPLRALASFFTLGSDQPTTHARALRTDAQGRAEFRLKSPHPDNPQGFDRVAFCCDRPGYDLAFAGATNAEDADVLLRLSRSREPWNGRVVDEARRPVAGAWVVVHSIMPDESGATVSVNGLSVLSATTGADGRFQFPRLARQCSLLLEVTAPGRARSLDWRPARNESEVVIPLGRAGTLAGKVTVKGGDTPVTTGTVFVSAPPDCYAAETIDRRGTFTVESLRPAEYRVRYQRPAAASSPYVQADPVYVTVEPGKQADLHLALAEGIEVSGTLIDRTAGQHAAARRFVNVESRDDDDWFLGGGTEVNPDGSWKIYLAPGTYRVRYIIQGFGQYRRFEEPDPLTVEKGKSYRNIVFEAK